jgi:hypothetical protein
MAQEIARVIRQRGDWVAGGRPKATMAIAGMRKVGWITQGYERPAMTR